MEHLLIHPSRLKGILELPPSKSEVLRLMLMAAATGSSCRIEACPEPICEDMLAMESVARCLGTLMIHNADGMRLEPCKLGFSDCCEVGACATALRMSLPVFLAGKTPVSYRMLPILAKRVLPGLRSLAAALGSFQIEEQLQNEHLLLRVSGELPREIHLPPLETSQFLSGLMIAMAAFPESVQSVSLSREPVSRPYLQMTLALLRSFGCEIACCGHCYTLSSLNWFMPPRLTPARDFSAAAPVLAMDAWGAELSIRCENPSASLQGDAVFIHLLNQMGAEVRWVQGVLAMKAPPVHGIHACCDDFPDIAPFIALAAARVNESSRLSGLSRLQGKESDRFAVTLKMLRNFGVDIQALNRDTWLIRGGKPLHGGKQADGQGDHRMAMLAICAALAADLPTHVTGTECLAKSWPNFIPVCTRLGGCIQCLPEPC